MGVTLVIQMLLSWLRQYYLIKLKLTLAIKESGKFLWHVLKLPMTFFSQRLAGDISNRISLNNEIANVISSDFTEVIINSIMASFYLILMLYLNISLTGVVVLIAVIIAVLWATGSFPEFWSLLERLFNFAFRSNGSESFWTNFLIVVLVVAAVAAVLKAGKTVKGD